MNKIIFNTYSRYYDLLYRDKDYASEVGYINALLALHGLKKGELLEFGSGTGKHGCLLATQGYIVHGIERSADMVAISKNAQGFTCQQGDMCTIDMGRTYDAVLSLFHVLSYQISNERLASVFARAAMHLVEGGLFVFDFWYTPAVCTQRPCVRVKRMKDEQVEITRIAEPVILPNENRVDVKYSIFVRNLASGIIENINETHPMRHFSLPEIDWLAEAHGFERIGAEEFLSGRDPSEDTWGVCVILRKRMTARDQCDDWCK